MAKPYVTGALLGQLGNQLFEVAAISAVAWDNDAAPYFPDLAATGRDPDSYYQRVLFRLNVTPPSRDVSTEFGAPAYGYATIPYQPGMKLSGYFQNEKYFAHHRARLLELFAPRADDLAYIQEKFAAILAHPETVSVHLRYYYAEKPDEDAFVQYDREYLAKAMALFPKSSLFVVTSDNIEFAKRNIPTEGLNVVFVEGEKYYIDFYLQSLCKHNIISNSTFSWWSAWLNQNPNKKVVRPEVWLQGYPDIGEPDGWIKVSARGLQQQLRERNHQSITGNALTYPQACKKAVEDESFFATFRSHPEYAPILECGFEGESARYLLSRASPETLASLENIRKLEQIGNPITYNLEGMGQFSGTTLRYAVIADQITKLFKLPRSPTIAEIGAGFGGQAYVMSQVRPFTAYYIYDLPEVERLIEKVSRTLSMKGVHLMALHASLPQERIDLLISNYAFSECDRHTQMDYFERVIKKADRGYVIFNAISSFDSFTADEFVMLLRANNMNPQLLPEPIFTYDKNVLIIWESSGLALRESEL